MYYNMNTYSVQFVSKWQTENPENNKSGYSAEQKPTKCWVLREGAVW